MTLTCINTLHRALPLSFPTAYLAKINAIVVYIFTGGLEMPSLMTGIDSHASTHPCAYYISASKSWDPDAPLRRLNFYARQFDKRMKT